MTDVSLSSQVQHIEIEIRSLIAFPGCVHGLRTPSLMAVIDVEDGAPQAVADMTDRLVDAVERNPSCAAMALSPSGNEGSGYGRLLRLGWLIRHLEHSAGLKAPDLPRLVAQRLPNEGKARIRLNLLIPSLLQDHSRRLLALLLRHLQEMLAHDSSCRDPGFDKSISSWVQRLAQLAPSGTNNPQLIAAAFRNNIPLIRIGSSHFQYGWGRRARWLRSSLSDATPNLGVQMARDKVVTHHLLAAAGIPVPQQTEISSAAGAVKAAEAIGYPVVVKPADLDGGTGARANLNSAAEVEHAFAQARRHTKRVLVEKHVSGGEYRLTVVNGKLFWAHERVPARITGDGTSSIEMLVQQENARRKAALAATPTGLRPIALDEKTIEYLAEQGLDLNFVPKTGEIVRVQRIPSALSGGSGIAVTDTIHPDNKLLAERAARLLRLDVAGIDLITPDITASWQEVGGAITEVNAIPQISRLTQADIHDRFLAQMISGNGRIPVAIVLGGSPDPALIRHLSSTGLRVGISAPEGLAIDGRTIRRGRRSPFEDVRSLQLDPEVDAIVVIVQGDEFKSTGLPFDAFDILLVNRSEPPRAALVGALLPHCTGVILSDEPTNESLRSMTFKNLPSQWTSRLKSAPSPLDLLPDLLVQAAQQERNDHAAE